MIEKNETRVNDEDEGIKEVEKKEKNVTPDSESNTIAKNDDDCNVVL